MYTINKLHGIVFHHFHKVNEIPQGQGSITSDKFEDIIKFIGLNKILNPEDWLEIQNTKRKNKSYVCLTFDDALLSQYEIALPILEKYNLKAFWFIYSSVFNGVLEEFEVFRKFRSIYFQSLDLFYDTFLKEYSKFDFPKIEFSTFGRKISYVKENASFFSDKDIKFRLIRDEIMSPKQFSILMQSMIAKCGTNCETIAQNLWLNDTHLKKLSEKEHLIGLHSYYHPFKFSDLSYESQFTQLKKNYDHILRVTSVTPKVISYPNNSYDHRTIKILKKLDIENGFRADMFNNKTLNGSNIKLETSRMDSSEILREI